MKKLNFKEDNILYLVIPSFNEEEVLLTTSNILKDILSSLIDKKKISAKSKILFVNDGSKDKTWNIISSLHEENNLFTGISLSRNKGHQNAVLAGLLTAVTHNADTTISIDADLQDDPNCIEMMIDKYNEGFEVVYGVRGSRKKDSFLKRFTAQAYYKVMKIMGVDLVYNSADCRLMSKRAIEALEQFSEVNLFLRGIVPLIGFKSTTVTYSRNERLAGESKYGIRKMFALANEGITSFSTRPLSLLTTFGWLFILTSIILVICLTTIAIYGLAQNILLGLFIATLVIGFVFVGLGVLGNYIGKTYLEVKKRPHYFIEEDLED
ncbi:MAG: glycosyltransferase family 2 protein [Bacilli bacterium]